MVNLPNKITFCRVILIPFVVIAAAYYQQGRDSIKYFALVLFVLASITDAIDGYIARTRNMQTRLGTFLDAFADKALLMSVFVIQHFNSAYSYHIPVWALIIIISRDLIIVSILVLYLTSESKITVQPNFLGKATTVLQMLTLGFLLLESSFSQYLWPLAIGVTILSAVSYLTREWRRLNSREFLS